MSDVKRTRGRPGSGLPPEEVMKQSVAERRKRLIREGKQDFKTFVEAGTKAGLQKLKAAMEVKTAGDVIDVLVQQEMKRRKLN